MIVDPRADPAMVQVTSVEARTSAGVPISGLSSTKSSPTSVPVSITASHM
jgi:hypothetical protein